MDTEMPIACTLSLRDDRARLAEIAALTQEALRGVERRGRTLDLRYAPGAAPRVRALVEKERRCCAFLSFELIEGPHEVRLLVTAPRSAEAAVAELLAELTGRQCDHAGAMRTAAWRVDQ